MDIIKINPINGLCNYLRVIFSYYHYAKIQKKKLQVFWHITKNCVGYFEDYFEKINDIEFIKCDEYYDTKLPEICEPLNDYRPEKMFVYQKS